MNVVKLTFRAISFLIGATLLGYFVIAAVWIVSISDNSALKWMCLTGTAFAIGTSIIVAESNSKEADR